jgi:hypothetical protein
MRLRTREGRWRRIVGPARNCPAAAGSPRTLRAPCSRSKEAEPQRHRTSSLSHHAVGV